MRYSQLLLNTNKQARQFDTINATLLQKGGFIDQTMAGVYTYLPLGWRVLNKIENIIRQEMDQFGAEMLMPAMAPEKLWQDTGRLETVDILMKAIAANDPSRKKNKANYILNSTHEEVITPIVKKNKPSYRDLPFAVYQIQTKFRNEERPKSGLLRGREFRMKDLYSFHATEEDLHTFYDSVKEGYQRIFDQLGIGEQTVIAKASGGDFTKDFSHEFNTKCETGEDTVYYDAENKEYYNQEVAPQAVIEAGESHQVCEVGNIFPLETKYSKAFDYYYVDQNSQKNPVYMASYGIGSSRVMGVIVELFHDDKGIIWPENIAPYQVYLTTINADDPQVEQRGEELYQKLLAHNIEVMFDDRKSASAGEKLTDADLIGTPWRLVISSRTGNKIEAKKRDEQETNLLTIEQLLTNLEKQ